MEINITEEIEKIKKEITKNNEQKAVAQAQLQDIDEKLKELGLTRDELPQKILDLQVKIQDSEKKIIEQIAEFKRVSNDI